MDKSRLTATLVILLHCLCPNLRYIEVGDKRSSPSQTKAI